MNLEQLIQTFFRKQLDQHQQAFLKSTIENKPSIETINPETINPEENSALTAELTNMATNPMDDHLNQRREPPWQEQVPPDFIKIDLQEKIDKYAIPPKKVNPYDGNEGKLKHRNSAYLEQLSIKNHPQKGLKAFQS
jgi:hypothetical protein